MTSTRPVPRPVAPADPGVRPLPVGIVGVGEQAVGKLLPVLMSAAEVQLAAVCDVVPERAEAAARAYSIPRTFTAVTDLLDEVEVAALVVACPPQVHEAIARLALGRGIPVFVEKPPTVDSSALRGLAALAAATGVATGVGMNFRHAAPYRQVRELLARGEYGRPVSITVRHLASKPRAPMWGLPLLRTFLLAQAIHPVDLLLDLGGPAASATVSRRVEPDGILLDAQVTFADGTSGRVLTGTYAPRFDTRLDVLTDTGVTIALSGMSELTVAGVPTRIAPTDSRAWSHLWRPSPLDTGYERTGFSGELLEFVAAAGGGKAFHPGLADLLPTYDLLEVLESA